MPVPATRTAIRTGPRLVPTLPPVPRAVRRWAARVAAPVLRWPVESQQHARRNAMLACTDLAARRAERDAVEDYLGTLPAAAAAVPG